MPKSKLRKNHKQKLVNRQQKKIAKISEIVKLRREKERELIEELKAKYGMITDNTGDGVEILEDIKIGSNEEE